MKVVSPFVQSKNIVGFGERFFWDPVVASDERVDGGESKRR